MLRIAVRLPNADKVEHCFLPDEPTKVRNAYVSQLLVAYFGWGWLRYTEGLSGCMSRALSCCILDATLLKIPHQIYNYHLNVHTLHVTKATSPAP